jgi:hypothetical protein
MIAPLNYGAAAAALLLAILVAGCAGDAAEQLLVRPGAFNYLSCPELVAAQQTAQKREQELKVLIDRAEKESIGVVIAAASYRGDYVRSQGEQKAVAEVIRQKNCPPDTPPQAPAPKPASKHGGKH